MLSSHICIAVTIVECEDDKGERSFQSKCPPGTTQIDVRQINTGSQPSTPDDVETLTSILYTVPGCVVCGDVQEFLESRNVIVTVKDASSLQVVQDELRELTGELRVPVVTIGDNILRGYNRAELTAALESMGYSPE